MIWLADGVKDRGMRGADCSGSGDNICYGRKLAAIIDLYVNVIVGNQETSFQSEV